MYQEEFTPQQYKKFNGQSIMMALETMGGLATADALTHHIGVVIDQPESIVKPEVKQVLRRGVANGFLQRRGKNYFLFSRGSSYQVDGKRKRNTSETNVSNKRRRLSPSNDTDCEDDLDDENNNDLELDLEKQSIEGLQDILSKANEDSEKATILATRAVKRAQLASMKIVKLIRNIETEPVE